MIKLINEDFYNTQIDKIGKIDLIIADIPDNIGLKYDGFADNENYIVYISNVTKWLYRMRDITDGPIFFTFNEKWTRFVEQTIFDLEIPIVQRLHWYYKFGQDQTSKGKYALCHRPIYWLNSNFSIPENIKVPSARQEKYKDKRAAKNGKMPPNVWEFPRICGTFKERRKHCPNQLPESLVERIIKGHCKPNGRVLDPFLGSGTTAIICQRLGINCVGIDISETYIKIATKNLGITHV